MKVTALNRRKALTAIPPTPSLEAGFIKHYHSWHKAIISVPMNPNAKQSNNNSLNIKWNFNYYDTKVFC